MTVAEELQKIGERLDYIERKQAEQSEILAALAANRTRELYLLAFLSPASAGLVVLLQRYFIR